MFYTYIIQSETLGMIYIGQTADVKKRIERHNAGGSKFTKNKGPWKLLFVDIIQNFASINGTATILI